MIQSILFDENEKGDIVSNQFKPGLNIDERIQKYGTKLEEQNGVCHCDAHRYKPYEDCIHIKELRLRNLQKIDDTILQHICDKRDERDKDNTGLDGAIDNQSEHRYEDLHKLMDIAINIAIGKGSVCSDDVHRVTNEAYRDDKIIGTAFAILSRTGMFVEIGRKPTERKCAHGRKINIYRLEEKVL